MLSLRAAALAAILGATVFLAACAASRPLTPVSAGTLASDLANRQCQASFGVRPFHPEDFEATLSEGRWSWGTPAGGKVDGYEVEVSFDQAGAKRQVLVRIPPE